MNVMRRLLLCALLVAYCAFAQAASADTAKVAKGCCSVATSYVNPLGKTLTGTLPLLTASLFYGVNNTNVARFRHENSPRFRSKYDDFLQFLPMTTQVTLHLTGVEGRSKHFGELASANALSVLLMMSSVTLGKKLTKVERPDGTSCNSFPSGHTAMAFASATMLHQEYGLRYPWLSALGYGAATGVGLGRILNNRHWVGDVVTGAFVGILSTELGYWINDRLWHRGRSYENSRTYGEAWGAGLYVSLLSRVSPGGDSPMSAAGLGLRYRCGERGYFGFVHTWMEMRDLLIEGKTRSSLSSTAVELGWGHEWVFGKPWLRLGTAASLRYSSKDKLYPVFSLFPQVVLSSRCSLRMDLVYSSRRPLRLLEKSGETHIYHMPRWSLGSAIEFRF